MSAMTVNHCLPLFDSTILAIVFGIISRLAVFKIKLFKLNAQICITVYSYKFTRNIPENLLAAPNNCVGLVANQYFLFCRNNIRIIT